VASAAAMGYDEATARLTGAGCVARSVGAHASKKVYAVENACGVDVGVMVKLEADLGQMIIALPRTPLYWSTGAPIGALTD
jgi:hypothetical protein